MTIENTHQPGAKRTSRLKTWQTPPGKQKCALRNFFCQRTCMAEPQCRRHRHSMMLLPQVPKRLRVSMRRSLYIFVFASSHKCSSLLHDVLRRKRMKRFPICIKKDKPLQKKDSKK